MRKSSLERTVVIPSYGRPFGLPKHEFKITSSRSWFLVACDCGLYESYPTFDKARWFAFNHPKLMIMRRSRALKLIREAEHNPPPAGYVSGKDSDKLAGESGRGCGDGT